MTLDRDLDLVDADDTPEREDDELAEIAGAEPPPAILPFIGGLLLGALIGAGIALLVAPERGTVTRRRIRSKLRDLQDDTRDRLEDLRDEAEEQLRHQRRKLKRRVQEQQ